MATFQEFIIFFQLDEKLLLYLTPQYKCWVFCIRKGVKRYYFNVACLTVYDIYESIKK